MTQTKREGELQAWVERLRQENFELKQKLEGADSDKPARFKKTPRKKANVKYDKTDTRIDVGDPEERQG